MSNRKKIFNLEKDKAHKLLSRTYPIVQILEELNENFVSKITKKLPKTKQPDLQLDSVESAIRLLEGRNKICTIS
ncbi:MAG: hypothetical protein FJ368_02955 [Pelagibacterales bacterium]|nr:hypothetical protein [Pelagibacterales bacterium]